MPTKKKAQQADRHKPSFLVRLPMRLRVILDRLHAKYERPITTEVRIALEKHARDEGVLDNPPKPSPS